MNYRSIVTYIIYLQLSIFIFGCTGSKSHLTIPEDKLLKVFFDLYAADNVVKESPKEIRDSLRQVYTEQIFKIHNTNQKEFEYNLTALQKEPEKFKKFYDKLDKYAEEMSMGKKNDKTPMDKK